MSYEDETNKIPAEQQPMHDHLAGISAGESFTLRGRLQHELAASALDASGIKVDTELASDLRKRVESQERIFDAKDNRHGLNSTFSGEAAGPTKNAIIDALQKQASTEGPNYNSPADNLISDREAAQALLDTLTDDPRKS